MIATDLLASNPLFAELDREQLGRLAAASHMLGLEAGECLAREAERPPPYLALLATGMLLALKSAHSGKETTLRIIRPGDVVFWAGLPDGGPAPATVRALQPSLVVRVPFEALTALMAREPALGMRLLATMSDRLREMAEQLHAVVSERARTRLARLILFHHVRDGGCATPTPLPHQVLSRMAGIAYEECVRIIGDWAHGDRPLLSYERGGRIAILDPGALAAIAEGLEPTLSLPTKGARPCAAS